MARPILAVTFGTFTLRLATGVTGAMLIYYLAVLPKYGGETVEAWEIGVMGALFYASELVLSPIFGVLSDRVGHRRMMLVGPAFGAVAVVITAFTVSLPVIGFTRLLEGASTAASIPSILGFIAFATASDELLRGKAVARFEAATLAGLMLGFVVAGPLFAAFGPTAFLLNAVLYGVSFAIYKLGVPEHAEPAPAAHGHDPEEGLHRYLRILRGSHVWLLAPTWIAINATLGLYTSQTLFQLVREPDPRFSEQQLMGGFDPLQVSAGLAIGGLLFFAGLFYWGGKFKSMRRTTIIVYGIIGGAVMLIAAAGHQPRGRRSPAAAPRPGRDRRGRAVRPRRSHAGRHRPARGHDRGLPGRPGRDHGPLLGVPGPRPDRGQHRGRRCRPGGWARRDLRRVADPPGVAFLPISRLRRYEHQVGGVATRAADA